MDRMLGTNGTLIRAKIIVELSIKKFINTSWA